MTSIRRPKRIIIRGDDERDHLFLVKGGEDLRQDQRIEQLFGVMNMILSQGHCLFSAEPGTPHLSGHSHHKQVLGWASHDSTCLLASL